MSNNAVGHFEIPADDPEKLVSFYHELFGWQIDKMPAEGDMAGVDYWMIRTVPTDDKGMPTVPGGINGGITRRMMPDQKPINYVMVESAKDYADKAQKLGASVLAPPMAIPGMGWFAWFSDPQGNPFAVFQEDAAAK